MGEDWSSGDTLEPFEVLGTCQVDYANEVEQSTQNHCWKDHPGGDDEDHDEDAGHDHEDLDGFHHGFGEGLVDGTHVFGKAVEDTSRGVGVEEAHRGLQDIVKHGIVKVFGGVHADFKEEKGAQSCQDDGSEDERSVDPDVGLLRREV